MSAVVFDGRLTYRDNSLPRKSKEGGLIEAYSDYDVRSIINRLAAYEDAEEQGRLVVLPCKVGDVIYRLDNSKIKKARVVGMRFNASGLRITYHYNYMGCCEGEGIFGETVFINREDAGKALEERSGNGTTDVQK